MFLVYKRPEDDLYEGGTETHISTSGEPIEAFIAQHGDSWLDNRGGDAVDVCAEGNNYCEEFRCVKDGDDVHVWNLETPEKIFSLSDYWNEDKIRRQNIPMLVHNDGGRKAAGFQGRTGDCACRALAIATHLEYKEAYDLINQYSKSERTGRRKRGKSNARTGVYTATFKKIMKDLGWKWKATMHIGSGCTVHVRIDELPTKGTYILNLSRHFSVMIDGVIHDTHDPSRQGTRCVYGYWYKD